MGLDRLHAEEEFRADLRIRRSIDDKLRHLRLALGQRLDTDAIQLPPLRPAMDLFAQLEKAARELDARAPRSFAAPPTGSRLSR